jgi:alpha-glucosidase
VNRAWWSDLVGYQVYVPSFADSDGDGWGDLRGVREHLDHLLWLGVDAVWLTPFYVTPMRDGGYDVADYRHVDSRFGDDDALDKLIRCAHNRGLRVLADLVVNHTSSDHPWFRDAQRSLDAKHRDFYIWRPPSSDNVPPNNWLSHFGGSAWTRSEATGESYLHLFSADQPDLNWANPDVADAVDEIMQHWYRRGIDGFRIDTAGYLAKDSGLRDNPVRPAGSLIDVTGATRDWRGQDHLHDIHQREVAAIHARWRRIADIYDALLVGEIYDLDPASLARYSGSDRLHSTFWFGLVEATWDPRRIADLLRAAVESGHRHSWTLGNHDRPRAATRFANRDGDSVGADRALAVHALLALLPGPLWFYQGDELGLPNSDVHAGGAYDPLRPLAEEGGRDAVRTPMPWDTGHGNGFTTGSPWLRSTDRPAELTVAHQLAHCDSTLHRTRRLLASRRTVASELADHGARLVATGNETLVRIDRGPITGLSNLGDTAVPIDADLTGAVLIFNTCKATAPQTDLAPLQAAWWRRPTSDGEIM